MPQNALFGLVVVTCWWRHNRQNRNHHLHVDHLRVDLLFISAHTTQRSD